VKFIGSAHHYQATQHTHVCRSGGSECTTPATKPASGRATQGSLIVSDGQHGGITEWQSR